MSRRHPDVDDCEVRLVLANEPDQLGSVTGLADHVVPSLLEQAHQALAQQDLVVGDGYPLHASPDPPQPPQTVCGRTGVGVDAAAAAGTVRADVSV